MIPTTTTRPTRRTHPLTPRPLALLVLSLWLWTALLGADDVPFRGEFFRDFPRGDIERIAVGDLNGDDWEDIVVVGLGGAGWFKNRATRPVIVDYVAFAAPTDTVPAQMAAIGDLNADGRADVVLWTTGDLVWLENEGGSAPTFPARHAIIMPAQSGVAMSLHVADLDGDTRRDILLGTVGACYWYRNLGGAPPTFEQHVLADQQNQPPSCGMSYEFARPVDLDGDDDLDLVSSGQGVVMWRNDGAAPPAFVPEVVFCEAPSLVYAVDVGDIDGDGDVDALALLGRWTGTGATLGRIFFNLSNLGDGTFETVQVERYLGTLPVLSVESQQLRVGLADFDRDGDLDAYGTGIHIENGFMEGYFWVENNGTGDWSAHNIDGNWYYPQFVLCELNRDAQPDAAMYTRFTGNPAGQVFGEINALPYLRIEAPRLVDLSGDGALQPGENGYLEVDVRNRSATDQVDTVLWYSSLNNALFSPLVPIHMGTIAVNTTTTVALPIVPLASACPRDVAISLQAQWGGVQPDVSAVNSSVVRLGPTLEASVGTGESPGVAIPDSSAAGIDRTLTIDVSLGRRQSVTVDVNIPHPHRGDLRILFAQPNAGFTVLKQADPNDHAADVVETYTLPSSNFGVPPAGDYRLRVIDELPGNTGTIASWAIDVEYTYDDCATYATPDVPSVPTQTLSSAAFAPFTGDGVFIGGATPVVGGGLGILYPPETPTTPFAFWFGGWKAIALPQLETTPGRLLATRATVSSDRPVDAGAVSRVRLEAIDGSIDHGSILIASGDHPHAISPSRVRPYLGYARACDFDVDGRNSLAWDGIDDGNPSGTALGVYLRAVEVGSADAAAFLGSANTIAAFEDFADWTYTNYGPFEAGEITFFEGGTGERRGDNVAHVDDDGPTGGAADWSFGEFQTPTQGLIATAAGATYNAVWIAAGDDGGGDGTVPQPRFTIRHVVPALGDEYVVRGAAPAFAVLGSGVPGVFEQFWVAPDVPGEPGPANLADDLVLAFGLVNFSANVPDRDGYVELFAMRIDELAPDDPNVP